MSSKTVPVRVISGFLGAGKTTCIRNLLGNTKERVAVLVNDFGEITVDAKILSGIGVDIMELPSGCVCCSLRGQLVDALLEILEKVRPERIYIEPSGISTLSGIVDVLNNRRLTSLIELEPLAVLVDAASFLDYYQSEDLGNFFVDQISHADIILINKCDLVSPHQVAKIQGVIEGLNPRAVVLETTYGEVDLPSKAKRQATAACEHHAPALTMETFSMTRPRLLSSTELYEFQRLLDRGEYGTIYRAKGILDTAEGRVYYSYVPGQTSIVPAGEVTDETGILFIGYRINAAELRRYFHPVG